MNDTVIRVQNVSKCYQIYDAPRDRLKQFFMPRLQHLAGREAKQYFREFWALKDISFEINKGETVGIIGRNGSGKSTLLQLICGTLSPTEGDIQTVGRIAALLELGSGFNPEFTGRENVYLSCALLGLSREETDDRFDQIAGFADIGDFIEQPVKTYSSGMFVRLAFAVNIVSEPEIMIVDEALAVGDMRFQAKCMTALTRIQERGATVLFVSHDINALKSLCSRGIYLDRGVLLRVGNAGDVAADYVRNMREEMNEDNSRLAAISNPENEASNTHGVRKVSGRECFKISESFERQVADFRYGNGEAKIKFADLLNEDEESVRYVDFDQKLLVRIYFESNIDGDVSVNYYILDEKKNVIIGAGLRQAGHPLLVVKKNGRYIVSFKTHVPLHEGNYSIQLQLTKPVIVGEVAEFLDVIDDAIVFKIGRGEIGRIWSQVFVPNTVDIATVLT